MVKFEPLDRGKSRRILDRLAQVLYTDESPDFRTEDTDAGALEVCRGVSPGRRARS